MVIGTMQESIVEYRGSVVNFVPVVAGRRVEDGKQEDDRRGNTGVG